MRDVASQYTGVLSCACSASVMSNQKCLVTTHVCTGKAPGQCEGCGSSTRWQPYVDFQGRRWLL